MNKILRILVLTGICIAASAAAGGISSGAGSRYKFIVNYGMSFGGESASKVEALLNSLGGVINKKTGIRIDMISAQSSEEAYEKLKSGEADFGIIRPMQYVRAI